MLTPMQATFRKLLIALPLTVALSATGWAQTTAIAGDVKDVDGKGLAGAQIVIVRTDVKANYKVKTDKKGHYYYGGLSIGTYNVMLQVEGKDVDAVQGVRTSLGDPKEINFDMKTVAARNAAAPAAGGAAPQSEKEAERGMSAADKAKYEAQKKEQAEAMAKNKALNDAFNAAREAQNAKNWDLAIENFNKAAEMGPEQHVVWGNMADAYAARAATKTGDAASGDIQKAVEAYQKALTIKPDDAAYHNNYALVLAKGKKFDEAQSELTKAAQLDPAQAGKYYFNLGAVYVNTGQNDPATEAFKKAIEVDPNYSEAYYQLGLTLFGKATTTPEGKILPPAGTAEAFNKYLEQQPMGPNADAAKAMLEAMGSKVETNFEKPGQKKAAPATKKKQ
jgi:tetratricopeptide (TPR) repeat protein